MSTHSMRTLFALLVALYPLALTPEKPKAPPAPTPALQQPCTGSQDQLVVIIKGEDMVLLDQVNLMGELADLHNPAVDELLDRHTKEQIEFVRALARLKRDYAERHPEVIGK